MLENAGIMAHVLLDMKKSIKQIVCNNPVVTGRLL